MLEPIDVGLERKWNVVGKCNLGHLANLLDKLAVTLSFA